MSFSELGFLPQVVGLADQSVKIFEIAKFAACDGKLSPQCWRAILASGKRKLRALDFDQ